MKIIFLSDSPNAPGYIPRVRYFIDYLRANGHSVDWISETESNRKNDFLGTQCNGFPYLKGGKIEWLLKIFVNLLFDHKGRYFAKKAQHFFDTNQYEVIVCSTSFNAFPTTTAAYLASIYNKPLIIDFRDILEQTPIKSNHIFRHKTPKIFGEIIAKLYKYRQISRRNKSLTKATSLISVSRWHRSFLQQFCPDTHIIYNGFDERQFKKQEIISPYFCLSYFGELMNTNLRHPHVFFQAIQNLKNKGLLINELRIDWFVNDESRLMIEKLSEEFDIVEFMRYRKMIQGDILAKEMNQASILLIFSHNPKVSGYNGIMTTKFFEYVGASRPILLSPNNGDELSNTLENISAGIASSDILTIEKFILEKQKEWLNNRYVATHISEENRINFARYNGAKLLEKIIKDISTDTTFKRN